MPTFAFLTAPAKLTLNLLRSQNALLPYFRIYSFGNMLMPDYYRRPITRPVSCYALFK